jgi:hypothetical protein
MRRHIRPEDLEPFLGSILVQAEALYAEWPVIEDAELERRESWNSGMKSRS